MRLSRAVERVDNKWWREQLPSDNALPVKASLPHSERQ
jgi:hypothetical protein